MAGAPQPEVGQRVRSDGNLQRMTTAGYSGTPLAKKLGVKPDHRVVLVDRPDVWEIPGLPAGATVTHILADRLADARPRPQIPTHRLADARPHPQNPLADSDVIVAFFRSLHELEASAGDLIGRLPMESSLWIAWPRRAGGHISDITENDLRRVFLPSGVVDVKVAALDDDWSGLKFVWRKERRPRRPTAR
jgi:hypothetical protein